MSELGNTARNAIDALKGSPVLLALIILNVIFMAAIFYSVRQVRAQEYELRKQLTEMLVSCISKDTQH